MPLRHRQKTAKVKYCTTCGCDLRRHGCTSKTCRYPYRFATEEEIKHRVAAAVREREATQAVMSQSINPPSETQTVAYWQRLEGKTRNVTYRAWLRMQLLEWLRLQSLKLGMAYLSLDELPKEKRVAFLSEHAIDLRHIQTGKYHVLVTHKRVSWMFFNASRKGEPLLVPRPITVLRPVRVKVFDPPKAETITERTLLNLAWEDRDRAQPMAPSPSRLFLSVDYEHELSDLVKEFKGLVQKTKAPRVAESRRKRGRFSGQKRSLVHMWEALYLWETLRLADKDKAPPLHTVGWKAQSFGPRNKDRYAYSNYYLSRGHDVRSLAEHMIQTALQPQAEWWKRFS